jgi:hypothetical protein
LTGFETSVVTKKQWQFFAHPDHERLVKVIENCVTEARPQKYPPIMPGEWMIKRLTATY